MNKSIRTNVDTVCIGDSILIGEAWERIVRIANGNFNTNNDFDRNTIIVTESHTVAVPAGAMVEVR